jgi:hypothetical protein
MKILVLTMILDPKTMRQSLFVLICTLAVWLHLKCGLSRAATNQVLKVLELLVIMAINFGRLLAKHQSNAQLDLPRFPHDVNTAINSLSLEPKILRSICCPKCFTKYSLSSLPEICF